MDQAAENIGTEIIDEQAQPPAKENKRLWLLIGAGSALLILAVAGFWVAARPHSRQAPERTSEDLEQLKYDAEQKEQELQKASRIRDDNFVMRKEDDSQAGLNSLLKEMHLDKDQAADQPALGGDPRAKIQEEQIAHIMNDPGAAPSYQPRFYGSPAGPAQTSQTYTSSEADIRPMFVYSRSFGGAKYVDAPKQSLERPIAESQSAPSKSLVTGGSGQARPTLPREEQKTTLPPVTLFEGEMIEAVLVNRIITDSDASPVICRIARDVFDNSASYVVLPANSIIIGKSYVVDYKGAHRLIISFHRIILPKGKSIELPSKQEARALDETGALGVASKVEQHWFEQFGTAIFFGMLDGLAGATQRNRDLFSTSSIILGRTSDNFERILENIMAQYSTIVPTIRVDQGKKMRIYISEDIVISPYAKISDRSYYAKQ